MKDQRGNCNSVRIRYVGCSEVFRRSVLGERLMRHIRKVRPWATGWACCAISSTTRSRSSTVGTSSNVQAAPAIPVTGRADRPGCPHDARLVSQRGPENLLDRRTGKAAGHGIRPGRLPVRLSFVGGGGGIARVGIFVSQRGSGPECRQRWSRRAPPLASTRTCGRPRR
jgi:hypothetical protein